MAAKLISIIGPVAVGKTTLAEALARELPGDVLYEDYASNPFLAESFTTQAELMLPSQLYFLLSRVRQLSRSTCRAEGFSSATTDSAKTAFSPLSVWGPRT
jgi:deoxyadenosine/deoxycytidine kinase